MSKKVIKIVAIIVGIAVLTVLLLVLPVALTRKTIPISELKRVALEYATARCRKDVKENNKDDTFCDKLVITIGDKQEDFAAVVWSAGARRADTNEIYSSFMINSNDGHPAVDESTYVLNIGQ